MARRGTIAQRAEALLGTAVVATTPLAGGDVCNATRLRLSTGASALVKTRPHAPADFFRTEAAGLRWLGEAAGVAVPEVLAAEDDCLVLAWVEGARPSAEAAERLGRSLAALHAAGAPAFGGDRGATATSARCRCATGRPTSWPEFYATQRVLPYLKLARDRQGISADGRRGRRGRGAAARRPRRSRGAAGPAARRPVGRQPDLGRGRAGCG